MSGKGKRCKGKGKGKGKGAKTCTDRTLGIPCLRKAVYGGLPGLCKAHGGGKRCTHAAGCTKSAQGGLFCVAHDPARITAKAEVQAKKAEAKKAEKEAKMAFATAKLIAAGVAKEDGPSAAVQLFQFNARLLTQDQLLMVSAPSPLPPPRAPPQLTRNPPASLGV